MKAELTTGEVVTLPKGCDCAIHREPHWVHMWRLDRDMTLRQIRPLLEKMDSVKAAADVNGGAVAFSQFIEFEQAKLAVSAYAGDMARIYDSALAEFKRRGIARLIEEEADRLDEVSAQRISGHWKSLLPPEPEITPYVDKQTEVRMKARETI